MLVLLQTISHLKLYFKKLLFGVKLCCGKYSTGKILIGENRWNFKIKFSLFLCRNLTLLNILLLSPFNSNTINRKTAMKMHSDMQCFLNNLNLPIFCYLTIEICTLTLCSEYLQKSHLSFLLGCHFPSSPELLK